MVHKIHSPHVSSCVFVALFGVPIALGCVPAAAQEWRGAQSTTTAPDSTPCVLLRNSNVVFGTARQLGEQVLVERGDGSHIRLDRKDVLCWSDSLQNLYQYRLDHRAGDNVAAHLGDARWCLRYGLLKQANEEVEHVRKLDPANPQVELLYRQIKGAIANLGNTPEPSTTDATADEPTLFESSVTVDNSPVSLVDHEDAAIAVDPDQLQEFVSQVQPILLNRCGSCHSHHSKQDWQLVAPSRGVRTSARMARENYVATIRYIDLSAPESSELLRYALNAHGGGPTALGPRNALATQTLKRWLQSVTNHQTQNPNPSGAPSPSTSANAVETVPERSAKSTLPNDLTSLKAPTEESANKTGLQRLPQVTNPFDPDLFNRRFHPDAVTSEP